MKNNTPKKKVLLLASDDATISIIAQAVLNKHLRDVQAFSAGINSVKNIDKNTKRLLQEDNSWSEDFRAKVLSELEDESFDLVIILSEYAMKKSPKFSSTTDIIEIEYDSLDGASYSEFKAALKLIQMEITPIVRMHFAL